ncbi:MAG: SPOR domain-containing protein, partial [Bacteroidota bacterium]|nr:SPOR domain-containing protein [Bacteroidota bacterium]
SIIKNDTIKEKINSSLNSTTNKKAALFYKEESKEKSSKNIYNKFYIIAGSFKLERNAKKFAAELEKKGYSAEVIYFNNNLYRISIDVFNNESEALKELYKIRAKNNLKSVWLYKTS